MLLVTVKFPMLKISCGIAGTIYALVRKTDIIEGIPKTIAVLILNNPYVIEN